MLARPKVFANIVLHSLDIGSPPFRCLPVGKYLINPAKSQDMHFLYRQAQPVQCHRPEALVQSPERFVFLQERRHF